MYTQQFKTIADLKAANQNKNPQFLSHLSQVPKTVCIKLLKKKELILKNFTANFESYAFTLSNVNNCAINPT